MEKCGICSKELKFVTHSHLKFHNMTTKEYFAQFPQSLSSWNVGLTKETDSRIKGGHSKGYNLGHPGYYSREFLGNEKFEEIEKIRSAKHKLHINRDSCRKGQVLGVESRKKNNSMKWKADAKGRTSEKYKGRIPWNKGLTKYTNPLVKKLADAKRKHPENYDWKTEGWTLELRQKIRNHDGWKCQNCGMLQHNLKDVLVVHHKDGNHGNNLEENLISLCRKCHLIIHHEMRKEIIHTPVEMLH